MIEIQAKKHDNFSIELKVGYIADKQSRKDRFSLNMWLFVPNSLDINPGTYTKGQFYRDIKSKVRLITPVYALGEIAGGQQIPLLNLENSFRILASYPSRNNIADYEYEIKMFMAILHSSIRDTTRDIIVTRSQDSITAKNHAYLEDIRKITASYRALKRLINVPSVPQERYNYFLFGDEFMSNTVESYLFSLIKNLKKKAKRNIHNSSAILQPLY